jgi:hypothetical protein
VEKVAQMSRKGHYPGGSTIVRTGWPKTTNAQKRQRKQLAKDKALRERDHKAYEALKKKGPVSASDSERPGMPQSPRRTKQRK